MSLYTPWTPAAPCLDPWEPRDGPPHLAGFCSSPTSSSMGHTGSLWAPQPPGHLDLPFLVLEAPHPDSRVCTTRTTCLIPVGVCHLRLPCPPGWTKDLTTWPHPGPTPWWDRLMVWAPGPPPTGLSAPWAWTCPCSPPPWTRGAPHADGLRQSLTPPGTAITSHRLSLGVTPGHSWGAEGLNPPSSGKSLHLLPSDPLSGGSPCQDHPARLQPRLVMMEGMKGIWG